MIVNDIEAWTETAQDLGLQHITAPEGDEAVILNTAHVTSGFVWVKTDELRAAEGDLEMRLITPEEALALMNRLRKLSQ